MKQPVIITIGYHSFLLPDDVGASQVVKCLSRATKCRYYGREIKLEEERQPEVSLSYVPRGTKVVDENDQPIQQAKLGLGLRKLKPQHVPALGWNDDLKLS